MVPVASTFLDRWFRRVGFLDRMSPLRVHPRIFAGIVGYHLLALLACIPWLFSWTGLVLAVAGIYVFGTLGINIGFHRLLTHRGFACPRWLERFLTLLGVCCWQGSPMNWVSVHRMHHQYSDEPEDPHSPKVSFFWSHMGWFMIIDPTIWNMNTYDRYARDLLRDRFFKSFERTRRWRLVQFIHWSIFFLGGLLTGGLMTKTSGRCIATRFELPDLGRIRPHGSGMAHYLVDQFAHAHVGVSQLRHPRSQQEQFPDRHHQQRRGLAQQSPRSAEKRSARCALV